MQKKTCTPPYVEGKMHMNIPPISMRKRRDKVTHMLHQ